MLGGLKMTALPRLGAASVFACAVLMLAAVAATSASAQSSSRPTFSLTSTSATGKVVLRAGAGSSVRGAVAVRNVTRRPVTVSLRPADIANAANGNADYVTGPLRRTGRWLRLDATSVSLAPGEMRRVGFTVSVPAGMRGDKYAGIVAVDAAELKSASSKRARRSGFSFSRINRQAMAVTVRLAGERARKLKLGSVKLKVEPVGAGLFVGLIPGGSTLTQSAKINLRVLRDKRTVFSHRSELGQLFPGSGVHVRVPWVGRPTPGRYRVLGTVRPVGAPVVRIDRTVQFDSTGQAELERETAPPVPRDSGLPIWVWVALLAAAVMLIGLSLAVWKLSRRPAQAGLQDSSGTAELSSPTAV